MDLELDFLNDSFIKSIFLSPIDEGEIIEIANMFATGKAVGYDGIPMSIIKQSINIISAPLVHVFNLSINHGIVPDEMKVAHIIPLFKSGDSATFIIIDQSLFFQVSQNFLPELFIIVC